MVALEVMEVGLPPQDFPDEVGQLALPPADLFGGLVCLIGVSFLSIVICDGAQDVPIG